MEIAFGQKLWGVILLAGFLFAAGITFLLYIRVPENRELTRFQQKLLMGLRFFSLFGAFLLFALPLVKSLKKITQPPVVVVAIDNSLSMTGISNQEAQKGVLTALNEDLLRGLKSKFEIVTYTFGEKTVRNEFPNFTEKRSDYGEMLKTVFGNHFNENVGALVIVGDGKFNQGENPVNEVLKFPFPVYTLATGDTVKTKDAAVSAIRVNKTAFTGNQFPVEADIRVSGFAGRRIQFSVVHKGQKVFSQFLNTESADFFVTIPFVLDAKAQGLQYYTAVAEEVPGEQNRTNNSWTFVIHILENKQKVAILSRGSHPDAGALKNALEQQVNYEVSLYTSEPYPDDISGFNLVVLNQIPSSSFSGKQYLENPKNARIPLLYVIGSQTLLPQLNQAGPGVEIISRAGNYEDAQPSLNEMFVAFTLSDELRENLSRYPPLKVPFAQYNADPALVPLAFQKIKNITTPAPLIAAGTVNGRKTGIISGEGIWRWRLYNYTMSGSHREFNELVDKLVQYLALRDNEDNFIIDSKPVYNETEHVQMTAEVYNDAYEMVTTPEVSIVLSDSTQKEYRYVFDRTSQFYRLDAGLLPVGEYRFRAGTVLGTEELSESGTFAVIPVNLEQIDLRADHGLLFRLSGETGGMLFTPDKSDALIQAILDNHSIKNTSYFQVMINELLNLRWIFFVLILLLGTEWFLRKFWGIY